MTMSSYSQGRDNNFNLIRIIAAYAVLVTHSFSLAIGSGAAEPFRSYLGITMGTIAVNIFFLTSGFLVTASLHSRKSMIEFVCARFFRIYPGLLVMLVLTTFLMGPIFSSLNVLAYFSSPQTYEYFAKCITLIFGVSYELPGVFQHNPYGMAINGSLWTLPGEIKMYAILAALWVTAKAFPFRIQTKLFKAAILLTAALSLAYIVLAHFKVMHRRSDIVFLYTFFCGAAFYTFRSKIPLSRMLFALFTALLLASVFAKEIFYLSYIVCLPYILFYIAYIPSGRIREYNKLGDYSYGMYIYAFPIQQMLVAIFPGASVSVLILSSTMVTALFSVMSWHIIEKPCLALKDRAVLYGRKFTNTAPHLKS